jgi:hypothetical protein
MNKVSCREFSVKRKCPTFGWFFTYFWLVFHLYMNQRSSKGTEGINGGMIWLASAWVAEHSLSSSLD